MPKATTSTAKTAVIISFLLFLLLFGSIAAILLSKTTAGRYVADIYQNGTLLQSIPLYQVTESYSFEIRGENGCTNVVEVHPGSIAITTANCPDKLCVHQGAVSNSLLPITCLPNRVVIQLRQIDQKSSAGNYDSEDNLGTADMITPDIITY